MGVFTNHSRSQKILDVKIIGLGKEDTKNPSNVVSNMCIINVLEN